MRIYAYARVITKEQNLDRQMVELKKYVDDEKYIFTDKLSGKDMERPQYQLLKKFVQKGDTIYIKSLDRLGRNKQLIKNELEYYRAEGVRVKADYPKEWQEVNAKWKAKELTAVKAMADLGLKKNTFYKLVNQYEGN